MNNIDRLAQIYERAKQDLILAQARLDEAHAQLVSACAQANEGTVRTEGSEYRVSITYSMNRTIDAAALDAVRAKVPVALFEQAIEYAPKIKLTGLRYLQNNEPDTYALLAQAITAKPAKPSVKVERIKAAAKAA